MAYQTDTCRYLPQRSTLIGYDNNWFAQYQANVTEWDIRSCCWQPDLPLGQHYNVAMRVQCQKSVGQGLNPI